MLSYQLSNTQCSVINYSRHAVHYRHIAYLFFNWKFVSFTDFIHFKWIHFLPIFIPLPILSTAPLTSPPWKPSTRSLYSQACSFVGFFVGFFGLFCFVFVVALFSDYTYK